MEGKTCTLSLKNNVNAVNNIINLNDTCKRSDGNTLLFLGCHPPPFSNLFQSNFCIDNVMYNCVEQYHQAKKASFFDDDLSHAKIMQETNPYKNEETWIQGKGI